MSQQHTPLSSPKAQGPAGSRVGSDLCLQTQFHRLWDHSFLASGICTLVCEAGIEACAGFLVGGAGACALVGGAGSWPSGGQGLSRDMSTGGYGLRMTLGSLSADGWDWVFPVPDGHPDGCCHPVGFLA